MIHALKSFQKEGDFATLIYQGENDHYQKIKVVNYQDYLS